MIFNILQGYIPICIIEHECILTTERNKQHYQQRRKYEKNLCITFPPNLDFFPYWISLQHAFFAKKKQGLN